MRWDLQKDVGSMSVGRNIQHGGRALEQIRCAGECKTRIGEKLSTLAMQKFIYQKDA